MYTLTIIFLILVSFFSYYYNQKYNYSSKIEEDTNPVPIIEWTNYASNYGFSFMYPSNTKVEANGSEIKVGNIIAKIEIFNCKDPIPSYQITSTTKLYGFRAQINEAEKFAYICNNTKTACLDIEKEKNFIETNNSKITEGFFHSFISSLNINKDFDKIPCADKIEKSTSNFWSKIF